MVKIFMMGLFLALIPQKMVLAGEDYICPEQPEVIVASSNLTVSRQICQASLKAIEFLARIDLLPKRTIRFQIIEGKLDSHGYLAYGSYDSQSDQVLLMSFEAIIKSQQEPQMYGEFFDSVHYSAAIAHEVTHALFQHHIEIKQPGTSAQEYLAHVTQLAVMPEVRREAIIKRMDVDAWLPGDTISDIYMAMNPGRFAVKSYKHFTALTDPDPFVQLLLNNKWFYVNVP